MKKTIFSFLVITFLNTSAIADNIIKDALDIFKKTGLDIRYVGDITLGEPYTKAGSFTGKHTHIPFTFHGGQWHGNSAQGFHGTIASVEGSVINFTCQMGLGHPKDIKKEIVLKGLDKGDYIVNYQNPDGSIVYVGTIKLDN